MASRDEHRKGPEREDALGPEDLLPRLRAAVASACPHWLASEREDLVQASALRILEKLQADPEAAVNATYVWKTATSVVIDEARRARHRREGALDLSRDERPASPGSSAPDERLHRARLGRAIRACLDELERSRRHVMVLHLVGHKPAEIAGLLGWPSKKVRNLVFRAGIALRRCLTDKELGP